MSLRKRSIEGLMSCKGENALGPGGYNMSFFQCYWGTLKGDMIALFKKLHNMDSFS